MPQFPSGSLLKQRQPGPDVGRVAVRGVNDKKIHVRVGQGQFKLEVQKPVGGKLLDPLIQNVSKTVGDEPLGGTGARTELSRHKSQVLRRQRPDAQMVFRSVDLGSINHGASAAKRGHGIVMAQCHGAGGGFHAPSQRKGKRGTAFLAVGLDQQNLAPACLQRGGGQKCMPASVDV